MSLPIAATPVLKGKEAVNFLRKIENDLQKPLKYTPTPKLGQAKKLVKEYHAALEGRKLLFFAGLWRGGRKLSLSFLHLRVLLFRPGP